MYIFAYNFWLKGDRHWVGFKMFLLCRRIKCHATWPSLFDLDPRSKNEVDLSGSPCIYIYIVRFVSTRQTRWYLYYCSSYKNESYSWWKISPKNSFLILWPLEAKPLTLGQIWRQLAVSKFNSLSNAVFGFVLAIIVSEIIEVFRNDVWQSENSKILPFLGLEATVLTLAKYWLSGLYISLYPLVSCIL